MNSETLALLQSRLEADDLSGVAELLQKNEAGLHLATAKNCASPDRVLTAVRSVRMVDLLLRQGLTVAMVSDWWASGFGLDRVAPDLAEYLIRLGAVVTPHAAAALGLVDRLRTMLDQQPECIHAKGGDGGRPLHFSRNLETARLLVEGGAELDPQDDDHDSTPAQWRIGDAPEVTRYLLERGARPDLFLAAALNDLELAKKLVNDHPKCTTERIGNNQGSFPGIGFKGRGGTIYQWSLGFNQSAQEVAYHRGHRGLFDFLMKQTPARQRLLIACMLADRLSAEALVAQCPNLIGELDDEDRSLLAKCCWETNLNREAVRLMLDLGFPVAAPEFNHGYLPLHNAAWCGDAVLVELLLKWGHPVDRRDPTHQSTALGFAIHSCVTAQRHPEGDFPRVVQSLLEAGSPLDAHQYPTGHTGMDAVIAQRLNGGLSQTK